MKGLMIGYGAKGGGKQQVVEIKIADYQDIVGKEANQSGWVALYYEFVGIKVQDKKSFNLSGFEGA